MTHYLLPCNLDHSRKVAASFCLILYTLRSYEFPRSTIGHSLCKALKQDQTKGTRSIYKNQMRKVNRKKMASAKCCFAKLCASETLMSRIWTQGLFNYCFIFARVIWHFHIFSYLSELCVFWWLFTSQDFLWHLSRGIWISLAFSPVHICKNLSKDWQIMRVSIGFELTN